MPNIAIVSEVEDSERSEGTSRHAGMHEGLASGTGQGIVSVAVAPSQCLRRFRYTNPYHRRLS